MFWSRALPRSSGGDESVRIAVLLEKMNAAPNSLDEAEEDHVDSARISSAWREEEQDRSGGKYDKPDAVEPSPSVYIGKPAETEQEGCGDYPGSHLHSEKVLERGSRVGADAVEDCRQGGLR